jgi:hypothetical protein
MAHKEKGKVASSVFIGPKAAETVEEMAEVLEASVTEEEWFTLVNQRLGEISVTLRMR